MRPPPDHIDGHEHVHVLSGIRQPLLEVVSRRYARARPLLRDPSDRYTAPSPREMGRARRRLWSKALALGFAAAAREQRPADQPGVLRFLPLRCGRALCKRAARRRCRMPGRLHIVMCHPGHPRSRAATHSIRLSRRRRMEYDALMQRYVSARAHLAARARRRRSACRLAQVCEPDGAATWSTAAPGSQHPLRHGLAFLVCGSIAFGVDAIVLKLLTAGFGMHPIVARLFAISLAMVAGWLAHRTLHLPALDAAERRRVPALRRGRLGGLGHQLRDFRRHRHASARHRAALCPDRLVACGHGVRLPRHALRRVPPARARASV